jgi:hypothetical protein
MSSKQLRISWRSTYYIHPYRLPLQTLYLLLLSTYSYSLPTLTLSPLPHLTLLLSPPQQPVRAQHFQRITESISSASECEMAK